MDKGPDLCSGGLALHLCNVPEAGSLPDEEGDESPPYTPTMPSLALSGGRVAASLCSEREGGSEPEGSSTRLPGARPAQPCSAGEQVQSLDVNLESEH